MKSALERIIDFVDRPLKFALILLMSVLVLSTAWQVASRYFLREPSSWTEELARFALIWAGLLGAVYAYRTHAHAGIDILPIKASPSGRRRLEIISATCVIVFSIVVMVGGGGNLVALTARVEQTSAALGVQMALVYAIIPVCGALLALYALDRAMRPPDDVPARRKRRDGCRSRC